MSRLFDTLEQIKRNESRTAPSPAGNRPAAVAPGPRKNLRLILGVAIIAALVYAVPTFLPLVSSYFDSARQPPAGLDGSAPSTAAQSHPAGPDTASDNRYIPQSIEENQMFNEANLNRWTAALQQPDITPADRATLLNNIGAYQISLGNYWPGLQNLDEALLSQPDSVPALINSGVALTELGLYGAAGNYFRKAFLVDPRHPDLLRNAAVLKQLHILEEQFSAMYGGN